MVQLIDGVWTLEGFVEQKNAELGLLTGYIGIGQVGSKMVDAIAGKMNKAGNTMNPIMIINSNDRDMTSLENVPKMFQFVLEGYEKGIDKQSIIANGAHIFNAISENIAHCNKIYVVCSLGGGTGMGTHNVLIDAITDCMGIPFTKSKLHVDVRVSMLEEAIFIITLMR
ncbi:hypothetical protein [Paenibacillus agilis]|uniref:Tubulin/FtsZ GTPase domain-containing protein n=1 Tax=Paenibacillus agilis TaxID=3020863 RepID=A0A559IDD6_9BACL|nr:hypothetical protein [Paenibacillus agilis]TVX85636.1 hypothetical protein FPZ44_25120 [Paenibacillus agilis]